MKAEDLKRVLFFYLKDNELLGGEGVFIQVFGAGVWDSRRIDWRNINLLVGS
jgi:hypothetical protein